MAGASFYVYEAANWVYPSQIVRLESSAEWEKTMEWLIDYW